MLNSTFQMKKKLKILLLSVLFFSIIPLLVSARIYQARYDSTEFKIEYEGLVPCGCVTVMPAVEAREIDKTCGAVPGSATNEIYLHCQFCHFFIVFNNIVSFILTWVIPSLAVLMTVISGILFMISHISQTEVLPPGETGGPALLKRAKESFKSILIGLVIIYCSYLIIGLVLSAFGVVEWTTLNQWAKPNSSWFTISCPIELRAAPLPSPPVIGPIPTPFTEVGHPCEGESTAFCQPENWKYLAKCHNVPYPRKADERLTALINCVKNEIETPKKVEMGKTIELQKEGSLTTFFTFDETYEICNYMRGKNNWQTKCNTACSHSPYSCHYGGTSGATGALAVDFPYEAIKLPEWVKVNLKAYADEVRGLICSEIPCKKEDKNQIKQFDDATLAKIALLNDLTSSCAWGIAQNLTAEDSKKYYPWRTPTSALLGGDLGILIESNHLHVSFFCEGL